MMIYIILMCSLGFVVSRKIVLFRNSNLRTIGHPALEAVKNDQYVDLIYLEDREQLKNIEYNEYIQPALNDLKKRLEKDGKYLKILNNTQALEEWMKVEYRTVPEIIYASSPIAPYYNSDQEFKKYLETKDIPHQILWDGLSSSKIARPDHLSDNIQNMKYSTFKNAYNLNKLKEMELPGGDILKYDDIYISDTTNSNDDSNNNEETQGESLALQYIKDYIELGDIEFTRIYLDKYIEIHAKSIEHNKALKRLFTDDRNDLFEGEVFSGLMSPLMSLGCISPKLMLRARKYFRDPNQLYKTLEIPLLNNNCQIRNEIIRRDWSHQVAAAAQENYLEDTTGWKYSYRYWRGYMVREAVMQTSHDKPAIVLVHGFGGSIEQFTELAKKLSQNFSVIAVDSIGFGHSEKPSLSYNQYMWRDQIVDLAGRTEELTGWKGSVVLAGNSIGGFSVCSAAASLSVAQEDTDVKLPDCSGLILFNSAGRIVDNIGLNVDPNEELFNEYTGPNVLQLRLFGLGIFTLLQPNIKKTCEWLYPTNPNVVADGLAKNILRDSEDPGAPFILAAGGKLPKPRAVNALFKEFSGPVLICQGKLDPLNDAPKRAEQFQAIRNNVQVDLLDYGHCPMDEGPNDVANSILNFAKKNQLI